MSAGATEREIMALNTEQAMAVVAQRQTELYNGLRLALQEAVGRAWDVLGNVDDASLARFLEAVLPLSEATQLQVAELTRASMSTQLTLAGEPAAAAELTTLTDLAGLRGGVPPSAVYSRPTITMRTLLSAAGQEAAEEGVQRVAVSWLEAKARARARAVAAASVDAALAQRAAMEHAVLQANAAGARVVGYRRVLTGVSCRFCATASTQRYHPAPDGGDPELMPLHHHCDCGVAPIIGTFDPGHLVNGALLSKLKKAGPDYWKAAGYVDNDGNPIDPTKLRPAKVEPHGELGATFAPTSGGLELPLAERIAADRDRIRAILDNHRQVLPRPERPTRIPERSDFPEGWEGDQAYGNARADFFRELNEYDARYKEYDASLQGSRLFEPVPPDTSPLERLNAPLSQEGEELMAALTALGAQVRAEALSRLPPGLGDDIARALARTQATEAAQKEAWLEVVRIDKLNEERILRESYGGRTYAQLSGKEQGELALTVRRDPSRKDAIDTWSARKDEHGAAMTELTRLEGERFVAERAAYLEVLGELRPMGSGADLSFATRARSGASLEVQTAIKEAAEVYPEDWTKAVGSKMTLEHKKVDRGYFMPRANAKGHNEIALSRGQASVIPEKNAYYQVAVHELGHAAENTVPNLGVVERLFYVHRTHGEAAIPCWRGATGNDMGRPDRFPDIYFGKRYPPTTSNPDGMYELVTMSMERLFGGPGGAMDEEHVSWLLGTLVAV